MWPRETSYVKSHATQDDEVPSKWGDGQAENCREGVRLGKSKGPEPSKRALHSQRKSNIE